MQPFKKFALLLSFGLSSHALLYAQDILYVQPGSSLFIQPNAELFVEGNITLAAASNLTHQGRLWVNNNHITGNANWLDQTTVNPYSYGTGAVIFNSSGPQSATSPNQFGSLEVRNARLNLGSTVTASSWLLHSGIVHTANYRAVALSTLELAVQATSDNPNFSLSWFNGTLRRYIQPSAVDRYIFPVGNATQVSRAELDQLTTAPINATYIDATFRSKAGTDDGLFVTGEGLVLTTINNGGVWDLQPDVGNLSGLFDLRLYFNGFTGLTNNMFAILQRPLTSSNGADWVRPTGSSIPTINTAGRMVANGFAQRNGINLLGQFGIAQSTVLVLPVTLMDFTAIRRNPQQVAISWKVSGHDSHGTFYIERKLSTESNFQTVSTVPFLQNGPGTKDYHLTDPNTDIGKSSYRLKMVDRHGENKYSAIRVVHGQSISQGSVMIAPNPNRGVFSILVKNTEASQAFLSDAQGRLVRNIQFEANKPVQVTGLSAGMYFLSIPHFYEGGAAFKEKIVVLH